MGKITRIEDLLAQAQAKGYKGVMCKKEDEAYNYYKHNLKKK